ncbi:MAG: glycosyl transferase family 2 [Mucilaginibacter sp.]|nr:glycosyl transferase family 2 [Mucilaginibacter sp.]
MKFSVLTPSYNTGKYIERAIKSVLAQKYTNWEHIVIDGASDDNTIDILKIYPHLIWISAPDQGQSDAMNKAFAKSTGDIIIYLNADDELKSNALEHFKEAFDSYPGCDMIVADLEIDHSGVKSINSPSVSLRQVLNYWPCIFPANPVSYAYKKKLQTKVGPFPVNNHYSMDYWFLLRAFLKGKVLKKEFTAGTFHFDGLNKSADAENSRQWLKQVRNSFLMHYFYYPEVAKYIIRKIN